MHTRQMSHVPHMKHTYIHRYHALCPKSAQSPMKSPAFNRMSSISGALRHTASTITFASPSAVTTCNELWYTRAMRHIPHTMSHGTHTRRHGTRAISHSISSISGALLHTSSTTAFASSFVCDTHTMSHDIYTKSHGTLCIIYFLRK